MEEQKNKGVNKVEKLTEEATAKKTAATPGQKTATAPKQKTGAKTAPQKKKLTGTEKEKADAIARKKKAAEIKQAKREFQLKRKIELKKLKEQKYAEKLAKKQTNKESAARNLKTIKENKIKDEEKLLEIQKTSAKKPPTGESPEEKKQRIESERLAREKYKIAAKGLKEEKARIKKDMKETVKETEQSQKTVEKAATKEDKKRKKESGQTNYNKGLATAVVALGVCLLALGSVFTFYALDQAAMNAQLNNVYEKSYYDLVGYVDNIDVNMSKLMVSNSASEQQKLLTDLALQSELAENNISQLPFNENTRLSTAKVLNQVGDYSKTLSKKIASGETLDDKDYEVLESLYDVNSGLKSELQELTRGLNEDFKFTTLLKKDIGDNIVNIKFTDIENNSVDYPKMIYDGPFSDGLVNQELKGLKEPEVTKLEAEDKFKEYFSDYSFDTVDFQGEAVSSTIECYNFTAMTSYNAKLFAQISKKGGRLVMFNFYDGCKGINYTREECIAAADEYLIKLGFNDMKAVWVDEVGNHVTINYAYTIGDTIVYSDLVKVKVCMEKGIVTGIEALTYFLNHTGDRELKNAKLSAEEARSNLTQRLSIESVRLTIIPLGDDKETMAYEFMGTYRGITYYIYVDAVSGQEVEMFRVIEGSEGTMLI